MSILITLLYTPRRYNNYSPGLDNDTSIEFIFTLNVRDIKFSDTGIP